MKSKENVNDKGLGGGHRFPRQAAPAVSMASPVRSAWQPPCWKWPAMPETAPSVVIRQKDGQVPKPFLGPHSPQALRSSWPCCSLHQLAWAQTLPASCGCQVIILPKGQIGNLVPLLKSLQTCLLPTGFRRNAPPRYSKLSRKQPPRAFPAPSLIAPLHKLCAPSTAPPFFPTSLPLSCANPSWNIPSLMVKLLPIIHVHATASLKSSLDHPQM